MKGAFGKSHKGHVRNYQHPRPESQVHSEPINMVRSHLCSAFGFGLICCFGFFSEQRSHDSPVVQYATLATEKPVRQEAAKTMSFLPGRCDRGLGGARSSHRVVHVWILQSSQWDFYQTTDARVHTRQCRPGPPSQWSQMC